VTRWLMMTSDLNIAITYGDGRDSRRHHLSLSSSSLVVVVVVVSSLWSSHHCGRLIVIIVSSLSLSLYHSHLVSYFL